MNIDKDRSIVEKYQHLPFDKLVQAFEQTKTCNGEYICERERQVLELVFAVRSPPNELKYSLFALTPSYFFDLFGQREFEAMEAVHDQFVASKLTDPDDFAFFAEQNKAVINE